MSILLFAIIFFGIILLIIPLWFAVFIEVLQSEELHPAIKLLWLIGILWFPVIGLFTYIFFGRKSKEVAF